MQIDKRLESFSQRLKKIEGSSTSRVDLNENLAVLAKEIELFVSQAALYHRTEKILESLHFKQISERAANIPKAHKDTFQWSLSGEQTSLPAWLKTGRGIYWIEGKAGSGKSTLMKYLTKEDKTRELLDEWADSRPVTIVEHFFWGPGTDLQRGLTGLFRTLLFKILKENPELIPQVCPHRVEVNQFRHLESWNMDELGECMRKLSTIRTLSTKFCFFVDGLDEFKGNPNDLIAIISSIAQSEDMKLCVSSRPWVEFREAYGDLAWQLHVHDLTRNDIIQYVQDNLAQSKHYQALKVKFPDDASSFQTEIASKADGVFLWVYLVTRSLLRGLQHFDDIPILRKRLAEFPTELEEYFKAMLDSIDPVYWAQTSHLLSMLTYSRAPLPLRVFFASQAIQDDVCRFYRRVAAGEDSPLTGNMTKDKKEARKAAEALFESMEIAETSLSSFDDHDSQHFQDQITARCKDLICVHEGPEGSHGVSIGFLHRSVSDFLSLSSVATVLRERLWTGFDARSAFVQAYMVLMGHQFDRAYRTYLDPLVGSYAKGEELDKMRSLKKSYVMEEFVAAEGFLLRALFLITQLREDSKDAYERALLYVALCTSSKTHQILLKERKLSQLTDKQYGGKNYVLLDLLTDKQYGGKTHVLLDLLSNGLDPAGSKSSPGSGLWAFFNELDIMFPDCASYLELFIEGFRTPAPIAHVVQYLKGQWTITLSDSDEVELRALNTIDRSRLQQLLQKETQVGEGFWILCLEKLSFLDTNSCPSNIYDTARTLISCGMPRSLIFRNDGTGGCTSWRWDKDSRDDEFFRRCQIWRTARDNTPGATALGPKRIRVDTARVLEQIPQIADKCTNGMEDLFPPE